MKIKHLTFLFLCLCCGHSAFAKMNDFAPLQDTTKQKNYKLIALPIVAFTPETDWIFGGAGSLSFRFKGESKESLPSQLLAGGAYTLNKQVLTYLNYQLFYREELYKLYGELGYYIYTYPYFGVGNDLKEDNLETYEASFPRVRINALYLVRPKLYVGIRYLMDNFDIRDTEQNGLLETTKVSGSEGGFLSGLGLVLNYESRDNIFYPTKGRYAELVLLSNSKTLGSDFNFQKYSLDVSTYFSNKRKHVFALNLYGEFTFGDVPFYQMALFGGTRRMRGYIEGRYRDKQLLILQGEYRIPLFWRFGGVLFGGAGRVANNVNDLSFQDLHYNAGAGIRFTLDAKEKLNLRFDVGVGEDGPGYYLTFGEAF
ncbi:MAG: BamA/TamA family outer membrane protein [Saprospiraceae bacterium]